MVTPPAVAPTLVQIFGRGPAAGSVSGPPFSDSITGGPGIRMLRRNTAGPNDPTPGLVAGRLPAILLDHILCPCPFEEFDMKHSKLIAALATAGSLFAVNSAHAFAPAVAAGIAAVMGAGAGAAANQADRDRQANEAQRANQPAPIAVVPGNATVVLGGPSGVVQDAIPAPRDGYQWERGHFEIQNGVSTWIAGHWVAQ